MQDEVNEKTMALCIKGGKISVQILKAALTKLLAEIEKKKQQSKKMGGQNRCKRGKQSIKSLQQSGAQLTNIVVTDNNIKSFDRVARKYGIDYSLKKVEKEGKMKAVVSITIDDEFVVHDIKVIEGEKGLFIAMPSRKANDGEYRDIAHPINSATRENIQNMILEKYKTEIENV